MVLSGTKKYLVFLANRDIISGRVILGCECVYVYFDEHEGEKGKVEKNNLQWSVKCVVAIWASTEFKEKLVQVE